MSTPSTHWFEQARYGLFLHYGLYSLLERGEWVMNREGIPPDEYRKLRERFRAEGFDAGAIADLAVAGGMRYIVFTTLHHEGFRLYDTALSDFSAPRSPAGRDLVAEIIAAARERGLKIGLYHSLNNWSDQPDGVAALEDPQAREQFLDATFARLRELVTRYNPIDILWYDGWWPFSADGWRAREMNAVVREIQPHILFNGRNGLPGDFATPEQHLATPSPWRPWEACVTLNQSWGYHAADAYWKSPTQVIELLARTAQGRGNLLLNLGLRPDGSLPPEGAETVRAVGQWLRANGEAIFDTDLWTLDAHHRGEAHRADWCNHGPMTARGNTLYLIATKEPRTPYALSGFETAVQAVHRVDTGEPIVFRQEGPRLHLTPPPALEPGALPRVYRITCEGPVALYWTGGMRVPSVPHPRYDPVASDIAW